MGEDYRKETQNYFKEDVDMGRVRQRKEGSVKQGTETGSRLALPRTRERSMNKMIPGRRSRDADAKRGCSRFESQGDIIPGLYIKDKHEHRHQQLNLVERTLPVFCVMAT